jgi:hypothetical protein
MVLEEPFLFICNHSAAASPFYCHYNLYTFSEFMQMHTLHSDVLVSLWGMMADEISFAVLLVCLYETAFSVSSAASLSC